MPRLFSRSSFFSTALLASLMLLAACDTGTAPKKPTISTPAGTQAYVGNLALADLSYTLKPSDMTAASPYLAGVNKYAVKKPTKPIALSAAIISYRADGKSQKLMVPLGAAGTKTGSYNYVQQATHQLHGHSPEYRAIHIRTVTVASREPVAKNGDTESKVEDLYQTIYESAQTPPRLDAARLQIGLTKSFMNSGVRDAAYVSLENAKELLAGVDTSRQEDANEVQSLSKELESLENSLHKKLPYTF